jgi:hypothetical protein
VGVLYAVVVGIPYCLLMRTVGLFLVSTVPVLAPARKIRPHRPRRNRHLLPGSHDDARKKLDALLSAASSSHTS